MAAKGKRGRQGRAETDDEKNARKMMDSIITPTRLDLEILKILAENPNASAADIGAILGKGADVILHQQKTPGYLLAHEQMFSPVADLLKNAARKAAIRLTELINHSDPYLAIKAVAIALGPWANSARVKVETGGDDGGCGPGSVLPDKVLVFRSTVRFDGSLVQQVIETDSGASDPDVAEGTILPAVTVERRPKGASDSDAQRRGDG